MLHDNLGECDEARTGAVKTRIAPSIIVPDHASRRHVTDGELQTTIVPLIDVEEVEPKEDVRRSRELSAMESDSARGLGTRLVPPPYIARAICPAAHVSPAC